MENSWEQQKWFRRNILGIVFIPWKGSGRKDTLFYTTDDKQKGHMGTPVFCLYHEAYLHCLDWES